MFWDTCLPEEFLHRVHVPVQFEIHEDESLAAKKILGFDLDGDRCFYFHIFQLTEERFDEEENIYEAICYREMIFGWKTREARWLKLKASADYAWGCNKRVSIHPMQLVEERDLYR